MKNKDKLVARVSFKVAKESKHVISNLTAVAPEFFLVEGDSVSELLGNLIKEIGGTAIACGNAAEISKDVVWTHRKI